MPADVHSMIADHLSSPELAHYMETHRQLRNMVSPEMHERKTQYTELRDAIDANDYERVEDLLENGPPQGMTHQMWYSLARRAPSINMRMALRFNAPQKFHRTIEDAFVHTGPPPLP